MSLWIKICANTSHDDAQLAVAAGADALGFVFAPSKRQVTVEQVRAIVPHLPLGIEKVGVFVDAGYDEIVSTVTACGLTGIQLHFDAPPQLALRLRARFGAGVRILGVLHFGPEPAAGTAAPQPLSTPDFGSGVKGAGFNVKGTGFSPYIQQPTQEGASAPEALLLDPSFDAILVDSRSATAPGGTGQAFDWHAAGATLFQNAKARKRALIAAGGLTPENVAEAIRILRPWGVDVASGVESSPGRKDPEKLRAFINNARAASRG
jgi:phosphoribosylanthranilate isomerase